ncbi:flagellar export chaperone FliS [Sporomusa sphaeroides]|uniref:flagellar export chaperone FliS n=1 Tax=Sporomusa sphaeroides TaxID=47679 RepID=UPI002BA13298|nr:flagellar export chaperone FliS [Sporomusa sphaeroides]HML34223.1 flagellar export chaperone FliS [Sporomusa sphaeroides]
MNAANTANVYKNQQIMTASPEELTLMLYNGAIRFIAESMQALDRGNLEKANAANLRAQDIVREFMCTLDMQYEISQNYYKLYDYIEYRLMQANIKKDKSQLEEAKNLLTELRDTWMQAMKLARGQQAAAK